MDIFIALRDPAETQQRELKGAPQEQWLLEKEEVVANEPFLRSDQRGFQKWSLLVITSAVGFVLGCYLGSVAAHYTRNDGCIFPVLPVSNILQRKLESTDFLAIDLGSSH